jgi:hypothetical protein
MPDGRQIANDSTISRACYSRTRLLHSIQVVPLQKLEEKKMGLCVCHGFYYDWIGKRQRPRGVHRDTMALAALSHGLLTYTAHLQAMVLCWVKDLNNDTSVTFPPMVRLFLFCCNKIILGENVTPKI